MKKCWDDIKSFITVITMLLFAYCIVVKSSVPQELQSGVVTVIGFFLGAQSVKKEGGNNNDNGLN